MKKIVIISGSPRNGSISNRIAVNLFKKLEKEENLQIDLIDMKESFMLPIQKVWQSKDDVPAEYLDLFTKMDEADGFIIVSPEYNGGYSSVMKNFLDHFSKPIFRQKAFGIVTGSTGLMGGMRAAQQLVQLSVALFGIVSPTLLVTPQMDKKFDENGVLLDGSFEKPIERFLEDYFWLVERLGK
ncbi:NADPH-dependent FMN reductase [Aquiflexum gelatinilyticum]|uniref:NAD(P)H-dependent oxidoreductase n=1 Tax=Aquiflexum gelatinilyticum TaxID=2961943 RepID=A0A9X2P368_9BACT|nr:NAD(P)H-dependent oxidoreductase [Aquiflexum gelatinilyticum]MCR9015294.1 NAD(P)H-dependent oxidoreductase [Aquiflexum gelatinilyticum]